MSRDVCQSTKCTALTTHAGGSHDSGEFLDVKLCILEVANNGESQLKYIG